ncbi:MAG: ABC transporter ATP-binding protein [Acidobacteriota bacterium]
MTGSFRQTALRVLPGGAALHAGPTARIVGVTKHYGSMQALGNVTLDANPGQAIALWGANGAGKSTLIKAMLGLIDFEGSITIAGHDIRTDGKAARRAIGYVPQQSSFYDLPLREAMEFYAAIKQVDAARCKELRVQLGLIEHERKLVSALSGGMKQRLALALALLADPPLLVLDEPTASLDMRVQREYLELLRQLRDAHKTIVFATHHIEEVEELADQVIVLEGGQVAARLAAQELRSWS